MKAKQSLGSRIRGWLPHDPSSSTNKIVRVSNKCPPQGDQKIYTKVGIANAVIVACFLVLQSFFDAFSTGWVSIILSGVLLAALIVMLDILLYRRYTKHAIADAEK